ncbi:2-amino-4-hydroxy-6-hydroxymethyldihydropteridine diphosphokinase [Caenimonas terrae]|uniref:2-amino-4-hydroxy-6-hydroxymethyldihydropteridine pyrophosphokinase n=1 Tax=Caenimonas terrae TaxID=696074 RepID=A0ABW0NG25_9BURK
MQGAPQREPVSAWIGLGANLGDARQAVLDAMDAIGAVPGTAVTQRSSLYRSAPLEAGGPDYINAVVEVRTALTAPELLAQLQRIEQGAGRTRPYRNAPRTLDLDLLLFGAGSIASARLTVPHPRLQERAFVLLPLAEIAPQAVPAEALAAVTSQVIARVT